MNAQIPYCSERGREPSRSPLALCTTYEGHDSAYLQRILPFVECIEVTPDAIAEIAPSGEITLHASSLADLKAMSADVKLILHGVGLSIASHDGYSQQYLRLLDLLFERLPIAWHSEHLAYTTVDGTHLGTMLAVPKTHEMLDLLCERVAAIQQRYPVPFLLENVVHFLPDYPGDYSEAAFLNALANQTGCGLLLDLYNLECDAQNHGFSVDAFLQTLRLEQVWELHLAGGTELDGFLVDVHSRPTRDSTIQLAQRVLREAPSVNVLTYELLPQAIPLMGYDGVVAELTRLRQLLLTDRRDT